MVLPLIEKSEKVDAKNAQEAHAALSALFPEVRVGLLTGRMDGAEKEQVMEAFRGGEIAILVAKNRRIEPVVEWLTEAGIPVASLSSLDIRKRRVVAELVSYLRFLETPSDDLSFADFITGDVFTRLTGLTREELRDFIFNAHRQQKGALLYAAFRNHPKYKEYWERHLDEPFRKVGYLPIYELVSLVYARFALFANFPEVFGRYSIITPKCSILN